MLNHDCDNHKATQDIATTLICSVVPRIITHCLIFLVMGGKSFDDCYVRSYGLHLEISDYKWSGLKSSYDLELFTWRPRFSPTLEAD